MISYLEKHFCGSQINVINTLKSNDNPMRPAFELNSVCIASRELFPIPVGILSMNIHNTLAFDIPQPFLGDFRLNDITFGSLLVTFSHVTSFPVT